MIVYQVIKDCSISYTKNGEDHNGFVLYKGDYFFIEPDAYWIKNDNRFGHEPTYIRKSLLVKIYHNKLLCFGDAPEDIRHEWTWIDNINLIDPKINGNISAETFDQINPFYGKPFCQDVTEQWERDSKLNKLI